ncbi:unnamed protein product [Meganyctiphanes norvegica]|uniref:Uncharacterized protein n=1 Tax=Meganyctiphanes norvegica TaxID=48144 RepID=A0AAV2RQF5_MEGNR
MEDTDAMKKKAEVLKEEMRKRQEEADAIKKIEAKRVEERKNAIAERIGEARTTDGLADEQLKELMNQYHERLFLIESQKYDFEQKIMRNQFEIDELYKYVFDLRGKFIKPKLKKVHHEYDDLSEVAA